MSVFWRLSVHEWSILDQRLRSRLDEYEEPVRQYLRGGPFPQNAALHIIVSSNEHPFRSMHVREGHHSEGNARFHHFMISGMMFVLHLGDIHPTDRLMCAHTSERRYICTAPAVDHFNTAITMGTFIRQAGLQDRVSVELVITKEDATELKRRLREQLAKKKYRH